MIIAGRLHIVQDSVGDQLRFRNIPTENQIDPPEQSSRAVSKTSSCQVNTTSRWGIKQLGFLLVLSSWGPRSSFLVARGNLWPPPLNDSPDHQ